MPSVFPLSLKSKPFSSSFLCLCSCSSWGGEEVGRAGIPSRRAINCCCILHGAMCAPTAGTAVTQAAEETTGLRSLPFHDLLVSSQGSTDLLKLIHLQQTQTGWWQLCLNAASPLPSAQSCCCCSGVPCSVRLEHKHTNSSWVNGIKSIPWNITVCLERASGPGTV